MVSIFRSTGNIQYEVRLIHGSSSISVTDMVVGIRRFTDTGSDTVNTAEIEFFSPDGELLTKGMPLIQDYDRFSIECKNLSDNKTIFYNVYEFAPREGAMDISETKKGGRRIRISLLGLEYHLQKVNYVFPHRWQSGHEVASNIIKYYNDNKGESQPDAVYDGGLPKTTRNTYPYDDSPESCYDRLTDLVNSFGAPTAAGGLLDFYTLESVTKEDGKLHISMRSLGDNTSNRMSRLTGGEDKLKEADIKTIDSAILEGQDEKDRDFGISPPKANRIVGIFDRQSGSLPVEFSRVRGREIRHEFLPVHDKGLRYRRGEEVQDGPPDGTRKPAYRCIIPEKTGGGEINLTPVDTELSDTTYWQRISHPDYINKDPVTGNDIGKYSPWTEGISGLWESVSANPTNVDHVLRMGRSMPDFNIAVKHDPNYQRYPVDWVGTSIISIPSELGIGEENGRTKVYRGFRMLYLGNGSADRSITDGASTGFGNNIVEFDGDKWFVRYLFERDANTSTSTPRGIISKAVDISRGSIYTYDSKEDSWSAIQDGTDFDCLHPYTSITNVDGVSPARIADGKQSAVKITYDIPGGLALYGSILGTEVAEDTAFFIGLVDPDDENNYKLFARDKRLYSLGCSIRFPFPFPSRQSTIGSKTYRVGELYGGGDNGEPSTLDTANNRYTHSGKIGYNNGDSEDLGGISSVYFFIKIGHFEPEPPGATPSNKLIVKPNSRMRAWFRDCFDNVIIHDFTIPFNDTWHYEEIPINAFIPYGARAPKEFANFFVIPKEIQPLNEFRYWDIKDFGITWLEPYDAEGRYDVSTQALETILEPLGGFLVKPSETTVSALFGRRVDITVDALGYKKELVVTSPPDKDKNLEEVIRIPRITTYSEGRYYVDSEVERLRFPNREYVLDLKGRFDIQYGDSFLYKNDKIINNDPDKLSTGETKDTIRLAALGVEHSITSEGLRTRISAIKRFE